MSTAALTKAHRRSTRRLAATAAVGVCCFAFGVLLLLVRLQ